MRLATAAVPLFLQLAAEPVRWRLLLQLAQSDLRVRELAERVGEPQNLVSYHVRLLREGGLLRTTRSTDDGRETYYHLDLDRCASEVALLRHALHPSPNMASPPVAARQKRPARSMSVLFLCTGNSARSPMAEAILRNRVGSGWTVSSAGSLPKAEFHRLAVTVLDELYNLRIRRARPQAWDAVSSAQFDVVISLCDRAREAWTRSSGNPPWAHWSIPDPAATVGRPGDYRAFQRAAQDIDTRVGHLVDQLAALNSREA